MAYGILTTTPPSKSSYVIHRGWKFSPKHSLRVTGVRYYAVAEGVSTVNLWNDGWRKIATAEVSHSAEGWVEQSLASPVILAANQVYTLSYDSSTGIGLDAGNAATTLNDAIVYAGATGGYEGYEIPNSEVLSHMFYVDIIFEEIDESEYSISGETLRSMASALRENAHSTKEIAPEEMYHNIVRSPLLKTNFQKAAFTRNFYRRMGAALFSTSLAAHPVVIGGWVATDVSSYNYSIDDTLLSQLLLGDGTTEPSASDTKLAGTALSGLTVTKTVTLTADANGYHRSCTYSIQNGNSTDVTISEIGLTNDRSNVLLYRALLDEPLTIAAGQTETLTLTIEFLYPGS